MDQSSPRISSVLMINDYLILRISTDKVEKMPTKTSLGQFSLGGESQHIQI